MKIGDEVYIHGYVDEIRQNVVIIRNDGGYFGTVAEEITSRSENPNTCEDAISRQAVQDLMRGLTRWCVRSEDGKWNNVGLLYDDVMFGIDRLPSVTPQPCEDAISRREALNAITMAEVRWQAVDNVNKLPSVSPQQRIGRWIGAEVLDKIRAEIETDLSHFCFDEWGNENPTWKEIKAIIDKYKAESEVQE